MDLDQLHPTAQDIALCGTETAGDIHLELADAFKHWRDVRDTLPESDREEVAGRWERLKETIDELERHFLWMALVAHSGIETADVEVFAQEFKRGAEKRVTAITLAVKDLGAAMRTYCDGGE